MKKLIFAVIFAAGAVAVTPAGAAPLSASGAAVQADTQLVQQVYHRGYHHGGYGYHRSYGHYRGYGYHHRHYHR